MRPTICRRVPRGRPMNTCWPKTPSRTTRSSSGCIPHDPMSDRIRDPCWATSLQAKAWHIAVQANSAVAYKSFYEKFSNGPYAQSALKMAAQPKIIPLSQPTRILAPASIKLGGFGASKEFRPHPGGAQGLPQGGGQIVTLPSPGSKIASGKNGADTGKIVTPLHQIGRTVASTPASHHPGSRVGKIGERPASKLDGKADPGREADFEILSAGRRPSGTGGHRERRQQPAGCESSQFRGSCRPGAGGWRLQDDAVRPKATPRPAPAVRPGAG